MQCFIELWKAKDAWLALSKEARTEFVGQIGPAVQTLVDNRMEIVNWGVNDNASPYRGEYDFWSVMKFPDKAAVENFENIVEAAGWYTYFDQINISGNGTMPDEVIGRLIEL